MKQIFAALTFIFLTFSIQAQLADDFLDGDFTNNPTWQGNADRFQINTGELQLNDANFDSPVSALYLNAPTQGATTWDFFVRLEFSPSGSNYASVYLSSNTNDFVSPTNGYYVLIGGSNDVVELRKHNGSSTSALISSATGVVDVSEPTVRVRVTRDAANNWELLWDNTGGTNYTSIGTATDATYPFGSYFGVRCNYTTTRKDKFFFDDFSIDPLFVDNIAPELNSVEVVDASQLRLLFNEPLDASSAAMVNNFMIDNGASFSSTILDATDASVVIANLTNSLINQTDYTVTSTVSDAAGNAATNTSAMFSFLIGEVAEPYDMLVNEIMADPSPVEGLPEAEFVEIYNKSNKVFNLSDYTLASGGTPQVMPEYFLLPGEYVVICDDSNISDFIDAGIINTIAVAGFNALTNGGDNVTIADLTNLVIHSVDYTDDCYQDVGKDDGGWTLELINPENLCDNSCGNWIASNDVSGGTPGAVNSTFNPSIILPQVLGASDENPTTIILTFNSAVSAADAANTANYSVNNGLGNPSTATVLSETMVSLSFATAFTPNVTYTVTATGISDCVGLNSIDLNNNTATFLLTEEAEPFDLMINEIMADPLPIINLPDAEFIEIYNRSNKVIDLQGYQISSNSTPQILGSYIMQPGDFVVVCDDEDAVAFQAIGITNITIIPSFPSLTNAGDNVTLANDAGVIIDAVDYTIEWYNNSVKDDGGWTLELINPENPCDISAGNWSASDSPNGGTPGQQNSIYNVSSTNSAVQLSTVEVIDPSQIKLTFSSAIDNMDAINISNYLINQSIGNPTAAILNNPNTVTLQFNPVLQGNIEYSITVSDINDCTGDNGIDPNANSTEFKLPEPEVISAVALYPSQVIIITYDTPMDPTTVANLSNYNLDGLGNPSSITILGPFTVELTFTTTLTNGTIYDLDVENVNNADGTTINSTTIPITYYEPVDIERYDIIINEILVDPSPVLGLKDLEFIELYNRSDKVISLEGFTWASGTSITSPFPFVVLQPNDYVIISKIDLENVDNNYDAYNNIELESTPSLTNSGDDITLFDVNGNVIDAVIYDFTWYQDTKKDGGGYTLERINPSAPCDGASNWRASTADGGGTPGAANSVLVDMPDIVTPKIAKAFAENAYNVDVFFTEAIDAVLTTDISLFSIDNGINIEAVTPKEPLNNLIRITIDATTPLQIQTVYELTISTSMTDCQGNPFAVDTKVEFALAEEIEAGDIIINEVLFNPITGGDDFIELYNHSDKNLNIGDLVIVSDVASDPNHPVETDLLLFPGDYVVITENPTNIMDTYIVLNENSLIKNDLPSLADKDGNITLIKDLDVIDEFTYYEEYHFALLDSVGGVSLERIDFDGATNDRNNWHSAASDVGYATPTYENSQYLIPVETVEDNEVFSLTDDTFSPDNDGYKDFLKIDYIVPNNGHLVNIKIFDAKGRIIKDLVENELLATEGFYQWDGTNDENSKARIGIYIVWIEMFDENGNVSIQKETCVLAGQL